MATRRDQLQSHQFLAQRVISALVMRETDPAQSPLRRGIGAVFAGVMISVMVAAGFGVYGLIAKVGNDKWKTNGSIVIEKDSGASYVYQGGELHPMLNYASALLATGSAPRATYRESASALRSVPRGVMLGITGAPDSLPSDLAGTPWTLCTGAGLTTLGIGERAADASPLGERGLLVDDSSSDPTYLIWHGTRFAVTPSVLPALFGAVTPQQVGAAWLTSLPEGPDIAPITLPGAGSPSPAAAPYAIGDLLATPVGTGGLQFWMVTGDGLAPITALEMDVAVSQGAAKPRQITTSAATAIHRDSLPGQTTLNALPVAPPSLVTADAERCATFTGAGTPTISIGGSIPAGTPTGSRAADGTVLADRVSVPPGHVAVVRAMAAAGSPTSGYDIVTDLGIRYPVASDDVLKMLGYAPASAVAMPAGLVRLISAGPDLDPAAATRPVSSASGGG